MEMNFYRTVLLAMTTFFIGCDEASKPVQTTIPATVLEGKMMGTFWRANMVGVNAKRARELRAKIQTQLDAGGQLLSTCKNDSALMRFNLSKSLSPWSVDDAMADIVASALRIGAKADGVIDITVRPLVSPWGFGPNRQPLRTLTRGQVGAAKAQAGLPHLKVMNEAHQNYLQKDLLDLYVGLSTVSEGYVADHLARLMEQEEIVRYLVSVGGTLNSRGTGVEGHPWRVTIQKSVDRENVVQAIVDIDGYGISTSGSHQGYHELDGRRLSHVIDLQTGHPIEHNLVFVTVIAPAVLETDGWDTGLVVFGLEKAKEVVCREGSTVYMIAKEGEGFKTRISPQPNSFLVSKNSQEARLWAFMFDDGDTLRLNAMLNRGVRNEKSFTYH